MDALLHTRILLIGTGQAPSPAGTQLWRAFTSAVGLDLQQAQLGGDGELPIIMEGIKHIVHVQLLPVSVVGARMALMAYGMAADVIIFMRDESASEDDLLPTWLPSIQRFMVANPPLIYCVCPPGKLEASNRIVETQWQTAVDEADEKGLEEPPFIDVTEIDSQSALTFLSQIVNDFLSVRDLHPGSLLLYCVLYIRAHYDDFSKYDLTQIPDPLLAVAFPGVAQGPQKQRDEGDGCNVV